METKLALKIELTEDVIRKYDDHTPSGLSVEEAMARRLAACADHDATRGLYFDDHRRQELEIIVGGMCKSPGDVISRLRQMTTVKVNGVDVQLDRTVLTRAEARAGAMRMSLEDWLKNEITVALEQAVGLR